jgi:hypothetical protein
LLSPQPIHSVPSLSEITVPPWWVVAIDGGQSSPFADGGQGRVASFPRITVSGAAGLATVPSALRVT